MALSKGHDVQHLSAGQVKALAAYLDGASDIEAGKAAGVSRETAWRWRAAEGEYLHFKQALYRRQRAAIDAAGRRLRINAVKAVKVLVTEMENSNARPGERIAAAKEVLERSGLKVAEPLEAPTFDEKAIDPTAPDAAEQLSRRLAEKLPADVLARAVEISQGETG